MTAVITAAATIICQVIISKRNSNLVVYGVDQLEKKVERHNNFIERLTKVEDRTKSNTHRLDKLDGEGE
ncbi:MAG: hypothetical protein IJV68_00440 [Clostridia bacterium]|nr:hypothetical protein [Clostridia bacterium]